MQERLYNILQATCRGERGQKKNNITNKALNFLSAVVQLQV